MALRLSALGAAVAVFAARRGAAPSAEAGARFSIDHDLGYPVYRAAQPLAACRAVLADWRPDVAVITFGPSTLPFVVLSLEAGIKVAIHATSVAPVDFAAEQIAHADIALIANSNFTARRLDTLFGLEPPVVLPLIEPERYRVAPKGDAVVLVNPIQQKGIETFFRLAASRPEIPFLAVESWTVSDAWRTVLINRARALGNVELWPATDDMRDVLARARLVLVPSLLEETFGRVVAEAQVSGIPALVSDRGALPETLGGGGIAVPLDAGIGAWLDGLDRLWSDAAFYRGCAEAALSEAARPERAPERIAADFLAVLNRF